MTPEQFFSKNMKWFALALLFLFLFKSMQSCNRKTMLDMNSGQYITQIDSLEKHINISERIYEDSIKTLNFQLELERNKALSADERARAVQSTAERVRANTTSTTNITLKGLEEVKDTTKIEEKKR